MLAHIDGQRRYVTEPIRVRSYDQSKDRYELETIWKAPQVATKCLGD